MQAHLTGIVTLFSLSFVEWTEGSRAEESGSSPRSLGNREKNGTKQGRSVKTTRNGTSSENRQNKKHRGTKKRNENSRETTE